MRNWQENMESMIMARASISFGHEAEVRREAYLLVPAAVWKGVAGAASGIAGWHVRRRQINRSIAALSALSDHMLKDVGIHRSEIASIAHTANDRTRFGR
jgi:uncharacterized protein YjiS (DUF1127 family)